MSELRLSNGKRKLVRVMMGEIWLLANGGLNENQAVKHLERLSAAVMQLQREITNGGGTEAGPVCLAIKEEVDELGRF